MPYLFFLFRYFLENDFPISYTDSIYHIVVVISRKRDCDIFGTSQSDTKRDENHALVYLRQITLTIAKQNFLDHLCSEDHVTADQECQRCVLPSLMQFLKVPHLDQFHVVYLRCHATS